MRHPLRKGVLSRLIMIMLSTGTVLSVASASAGAAVVQRSSGQPNAIGTNSIRLGPLVFLGAKLLPGETLVSASNGLVTFSRYTPGHATPATVFVSGFVDSGTVNFGDGTAWADDTIGSCFYPNTTTKSVTQPSFDYDVPVLTVSGTANQGGCPHF